jgi:hypothetical protein
MVNPNSPCRPGGKYHPFVVSGTRIRLLGIDRVLPGATLIMNWRAHLVVPKRWQASHHCPSCVGQPSPVGSQAYPPKLRTMASYHHRIEPMREVSRMVWLLPSISPVNTGVLVVSLNFIVPLQTETTGDSFVFRPSKHSGPIPTPHPSKPYVEGI